MSKNKYKDVDELKREQNLSEETFVEETAIDENGEVETTTKFVSCLLYTSDAADDAPRV